MVNNHFADEVVNALLVGTYQQVEATVPGIGVSYLFEKFLVGQRSVVITLGLDNPMSWWFKHLADGTV